MIHITYHKNNAYWINNRQYKINIRQRDTYYILFINHKVKIDKVGPHYNCVRTSSAKLIIY